MMPTQVAKVRQPENKTAPISPEAVSSNLQTVEVGADVTARQVATDVLKSFLSVVMSVDHTRAVELVGGVPVELFTDPNQRWAYQGIKAALDAGNDPTPVAVATAAVRSGYVVPPGLRGAPTSYLHSVLSIAQPPTTGEWLRSELLEAAVRSQVEDAAARVHSAAWRGEIGQLLELVLAEFNPVLEALDERVAAHV